ncbi:MAG: hypothetical protein DMD81_25420 [Candidatus Rokuibacteriota bacterium]|nr:MAG: hypothetical protein DMD81_25420 [Candidatus Rokubacteria bacterium]
MVSASLLFLSHSGTGAQDALGLDHFKCYRIVEGTPANDFVQLHDQFDVTADGVVQFEHVFVRDPVLFCNPVKKATSTGQVTPIVNEDNHLKMYFIAPTTAQTRTVLVTNQFTGTAITPLVVFQPLILAVPTQKRPHGPPERLDHFKCHLVDGKSVDLPVALADQFDTERVFVGRPLLLCNPTVKIHGQTIAGTDRDPALQDNVIKPGNPDAHLVCYRVVSPPTTAPTATPTRAVQVINQFDKEIIKVADPILLCVPSRKQLAG